MENLPKLPKGITKRGTSYRISIQVNGDRKTDTCKTLEAAIQVCASMKAGLYKNAGNAAEGSYKTWTVAECWEAFLVHRINNSMTNDPAKYKWYCKMIFEFFGPNTSIDELTSIRINEFFDEISVKRKYAPSTVNYLGTLVHRMQLFAHKRGRKASMPIRMESKRVGEGRIRFLSDAEEAQCLEWLRKSGNTDYMDLFAVYIDTGFRKSEALRLTWDDIDLKTGRVTAWKTKNGKPRTIKMSKRVRGILSDLYITKRMAQSTVFGHLKAKRFYEVFWAMRDYIGVGDDVQFVVHMLRHTCATRLVGAGVDLRSVMNWMGHSSIIQTQRYAHFIPSKLDDAANALDALADEKTAKNKSNVISMS